MSNIEKFLEMVQESDNIVFFGGAGVSTESGIPDFRSVDGLYNQKYDYPPETILSHTFYMRHTEEFYRFYRDKMLCLDAKPNVTHQKLAELEAAGKVKAVITQNIDGLHQMAGSRRVLELHGSVHRNYCQKCGKGFDAEYILKSGTFQFSQYSCFFILFCQKIIHDHFPPGVSYLLPYHFGTAVFYTTLQRLFFQNMSLWSNPLHLLFQLLLILHCHQTPLQNTVFHHPVN